MLAIFPDKWLASLAKWADDAPFFIAALSYVNVTARFFPVHQPSSAVSFLDQAVWPTGVEDWFWDQIEKNLAEPNYILAPIIIESNFWTSERINRLFNMVREHLGGPKNFAHYITSELFRHSALSLAARLRIIQSHQIDLKTLLGSAKLLGREPVLWQAIASLPGWSDLGTVNSCPLCNAASEIPATEAKKILARISKAMYHDPAGVPRLLEVASFARQMLTTASELQDPVLFQEAWRIYFYIRPDAAVQCWEDLPPEQKFRPAIQEMAWLLKHPDKTIRLQAPELIARLRAVLPVVRNPEPYRHSRQPDILLAKDTNQAARTP